MKKFERQGLAALPKGAAAPPAELNRLCGSAAAGCAAGWHTPGLGLGTAIYRAGTEGTAAAPQMHAPCGACMGIGGVCSGCLATRRASSTA